MAGSGSLLTGQSGSPLVESDVGNDSFGLLSGFGVSGPFTFLLQKNKLLFLTGKIALSLLYCGCPYVIRL